MGYNGFMTPFSCTRTRHRLWIWPLLLWALPVPALWAADTLQQARQLFERYVALEHSFDQRLTELYADDAVILTSRRHPDGSERNLQIPAPLYKDLLRQNLPAAKRQQDINTYTQARYTMEKGRVRIQVLRYSRLHDYSSPMSLLVGPGPEGRWLIYEEISQSPAVQ